MAKTVEQRLRKWVDENLGSVSIHGYVSIHIDELLGKTGPRTAVVEHAFAAYRLLVALVESRGVPVEPVLVVPLVTRKNKRKRAVPRNWEAAKKELGRQPPRLYMVEWRVPRGFAEEYRHALQIAPVPGLPGDASVYYREYRNWSDIENGGKCTRDLIVEYFPRFAGITREKGKLRRAFLDLMELPFPPGSRDRELSELHAELVDYDGFVAGSIWTLLDGGHPSPKNLRHDEDMEKRLARIIASGDEKRAKQAKVYADYLQALHHLLDLARELV